MLGWSGDVQLCVLFHSSFCLLSKVILRRYYPFIGTFLKVNAFNIWIFFVLPSVMFLGIFWLWGTLNIVLTPDETEGGVWMRIVKALFGRNGSHLSYWRSQLTESF